MELTSRQRAALTLLLRGGGETTLAQLAMRIGVSSRTVHRELSAIAPALKAAYGLILEGRSGRGLRIEGESAGVEACLRELETTVPRTQPAAERRALLAASLLDSSEGVKLFALSSDLASPTAVVRDDLERLRPWFLSHGLRLVLKRGLGVILEGSEEAVRRAYCALIVEQLGDEGLLSRLRVGDGEEAPATAFSAWVLTRFGASSLKTAEAVLGGLPKASLPPLALSDYLGLVVHLAVAAARLSQGRRLAVPASPDSQALASAVRVAEAASRAFGLDFGAGEVEALGFFIRGARLESADGDILEGVGIDGLEAVKALIGECARTTGRPFEGDRLLRDGLLAHWPPALFRLRHGLPIRNPLLERIRSGYPELFAAVSESLAALLPGIEVPADEIAYLVLHFGSSVERREKGRNRFRALVVCSAGIGSAHMLASRLRAEFPEIEVVANVSWFDLKDLSRQTYDFLVSTVPLPLPASDYVLVSALLDEDGVRAVREAIVLRERSIREGRAPAGMEGPGEDDSARGDITRYLGAGLAMLEGIRALRQVEAGQDWEGLLVPILDRLDEAGLLFDRARALGDLRERSRDGGIPLPGARLLFLHARTSGVERPSFVLMSLAGGPVRDPGGKALGSDFVVLLLAPPRTSPETQAILNEMSVSLLDPQTSETLLSADEAAIRAYYARSLDRYIRSAPAQGA